MRKQAIPILVFIFSVIPVFVIFAVSLIPAISSAATSQCVWEYHAYVPYGPDQFYTRTNGEGGATEKVFAVWKGPGAGRVPLARLVYPTGNGNPYGNHLSTVSRSEINKFSTGTFHLYTYEGVTGYVFSSPGTGLVPIYGWSYTWGSGYRKTRYLSTNPSGGSGLGWHYDGIIAYTAPNPSTVECGGTVPPPPPPDTPTPPTISGSPTCTTGVDQSYTVTSVDSDVNAMIHYGFDWAGGTTPSEWAPPTGYVKQGTPKTVKHKWLTDGPYTFSVQAVDSGGNASGWTTFDVTCTTASMCTPIICPPCYIKDGTGACIFDTTKTCNP